MKKKAQLYRMVTKKHICPYGLKSRDLLKRNNFEVEDHPLETREQTEQFKTQFNVNTTPQTFIDGQRIGGYEDLLDYFGKKNPKKEDGTTYQPVIAVFTVTFGLALAFSWHIDHSVQSLALLKFFIMISMSVLAILKLRDLYAFSNQFITYDLLAMRWVRYAYIYPFIEAIVGIGMIAQVGLWVLSPLSLFIGSVSALSVFKAVYVDKRDLKCACVGGNSNVPLGFVSLTENLMMVFMGLWILIEIQ